MTLSLIIAMDEKGLIGKGNKLPWHLPEDLKRFKQITMGHPIIMGRKTFESIGRILPGRENIVLTHDKDFKKEGVTILHSMEAVVAYVKAEEEAFVIGGAGLFKDAISHIKKMYLTQIHETFEGDVYLPELDLHNWKAIHTEEFPKDKNTPYAYRFSILTR